MIRILSHLNLFELKKLSHFGKKHVIIISMRKMNGSNFEPTRNQMHMLTRVIVPFGDF